MSERSRVLVVCDLIAPGGGPAGYTWNLRQALICLAPPDLDVRFAGIVTERRNRATGEDPAVRQPRHWNPRATLGRLRHRVGVALKGGARGTLRGEIAAADLVILQGYQDARRARFARSEDVTLWYMPHSPTIAADEFSAMHPRVTGIRRTLIHRRMVRAERALFRAADAVVFPSPRAATAYIEAFGDVLAEMPVHYILSGVPEPHETSKAQQGAAAAETNPGILFVGRYVADKGYDRFLAAAETLHAENPSLRFSTLGAGPERRPSSAVNDLGWRDDPVPVIAAAQMLVVPNRVAYFDLLPLEAAALGKALVFTAVGGGIDQHGLLPDSVLCAPDDVAGGIRDALARYEDDPLWGAANVPAFERTLTATAMAERWISTIRERRAGPHRTTPSALWVVPVAEIGGVARHVLDATRAGVPGWTITVLCPEGPLATRLREQGTAVIAGSFGPAFGVGASVRTLRRAVRVVHPEVVHSHLAFADIIVAATPLPRGIRRITTEHGIAGTDGVYHRSSVQARVMAIVHRVRLRRFDAVIAVAEATRSAMRAKWHARGPITVIPNGVEIPARVERIEAGGPRIMALSRLAPEKRIDALIDAFAALRPQRPTATLTVAGEGPLRAQLEAQAARLGVDVDFPGFVDPESAMAEADVIAQLSVWENCSYTLLDAVAHGLGVVASDAGGNGEIVGTERLVDPDDISAVVAALRDPPRVPYDRLSSIAQMTAAIALVYRGVVAGPRGRAARTATTDPDTTTDTDKENRAC
ncbi:glycosyltransferase family 4 protein [uncultured Microbacterium sp.]|uniref:glycosyltransferase family 4 protein n=1 Tax=uncultured Microbacterium sp. TaxID=191216 RepID=UPI0026039157|nr:glycosyltransferase family 4 protein [uncultured Microbacterium sp.]